MVPCEAAIEVHKVEQTLIADNRMDIHFHTSAVNGRSQIKDT